MKTLPIIITIFVGLIIFKLIKQRQSGKLSLTSLLAWLALWLAVLVVFWQPELTSSVALALGVRRGADLVIYLAIIVILYLLFRIFVRLNKLDESLTKIVREQAIKNVKDDKPR